MAYYATIQELINSVNENEISYRNLHTNAYIDTNGTIIKIPYKSIVRAYLPFFQQCVLTAKLTNDEILKYRFKPKKLSYDLYNTTELWSSILDLNNVYSVIDFDINEPKIFEPKAFKKLLNEALIMEGVIK